MPALVAKGMLMNSSQPTNPTGKQSDELRIYPNVSFSCNGWITAIVFAALSNPTLDDEMTEVQIWRLNDNSLHFVAKAASLAGATKSSSLNVYRLDLEERIAFQKGDIVGVHLPRNGSGKFFVQFEPLSEGDDAQVCALNQSFANFSAINLSESQILRDCDVPLMVIELGIS